MLGVQIIVHFNVSHVGEQNIEYESCRRHIGAIKSKNCTWTAVMNLPDKGGGVPPHYGIIIFIGAGNIFCYLLILTRAFKIMHCELANKE